MTRSFSKPGITLGLLCTSIGLLGGCAVAPDIVGADSTSVNQAATQSYQRMVQQAQAKGVLDTRSATAQRIHAVFNRMKPYANAANRTGVPFDWQLSVIRANDLNAGALPGGKMVFYTGMVERLQLSDDEIAAIIGHEMTHALNEHSRKAMGQQMMTQLAIGLAQALVVQQTGISTDTASLGGSLLAEYGMNLPFSRSQETDADRGGLVLMAQAGYNPQAAVSVWQKMNQANAGSNGVVSLLSTHPANNVRIADIQRQLPQVMPIYQKNKR